jgi:hypothetical protein
MVCILNTFTEKLGKYFVRGKRNLFKKRSKIKPFRAVKRGFRQKNKFKNVYCLTLAQFRYGVMSK